MLSDFASVIFAPEVLQAFGLTFKLATLTALGLLILATPIAWWLAQPHALAQSPGQRHGRAWVNAIVTLPLVLPPTVLGFYLLLLLSPQSFFGQWLHGLGLAQWAFSFTGLLIGSMVYSLPFAVHPLQNAFMQMGARPLEIAAVWGATPWTQFWRVVLPHTRAGFLTALLLTFAHTIGEFGVVLMIGGNIPGKTQVLSTLIYGNVEALNYHQAHVLSLSLVILTLVFLWGLARLNATKSSH